MAHGSQLPSERPLIVVVEGDEGVRLDLTHTLQQDGYRVLAARDCRAAISLVTGLDLPIDLIITNITVTYLEGHALLEDLARAYHHPPLLFFSTQAPPALHTALVEPVSPNPHAPEVLRIAVHRLLGLQHPETRASEETA
jgi:DNA-binding response OmpR family regulator